MKRSINLTYVAICAFVAAASLLYLSLRPATSPTSGLDLTFESTAGSGSDAMLTGGETVKTTDDEVAYFGETKGFFVRPDAEGTYPGVILIHEWWGLNDGIKDAARNLAAQGYLVLAVDLYDGKVATTPEEARAYTSSLDQAKAIENMRAALTFLKDQGAGKLASLGWCFGGGQSLQLALNQDLDATVIYYGRLETDPAKLKAINQPVLGVFGGTDASIPVESVRAFESALDGLKVENEVYVYPGVGHAFANPSGANYAPEETKDAWLKTLDFLGRHLR